MALPSTTVVPFTALPSCALSCGPLYDANGACVPPAAATAAATVYDQCFCSFHALQPFSTGSTGVCDGACTGTASTDLGSIASWFTSFCDQAGVANPTTSTASATGTSGASTAGGSSDSGGGGDWLSTHWKWVIMLVVMVVAIAGIWIGACIWRRHYLRKRDRQYALGKNMAHQTASGRVVPDASAGSLHVPAAGMFMPAPISSAGVYDEKARRPPKEKKKWVVTERT